MTGRLVTQKGLDLILGATELLGSDAQFVFLGSGEPRYEQALVELATSAPNRIGVQLDFTDRLEHRLMAGADIFLMPSLYEPCGLTQMRAQRYGAPPIVRRVGGLADTVEDGVTGFVFDGYTPEAFQEAGAPRAPRPTPTPRKWQAMVRRAMARDFSWERSVDQLPRGLPPRRRPAPRCARAADGLRPRAAQPPALRAQPRPLAARQRLALRGRARHLPAAARVTCAPSRPSESPRRSPSASRRSSPTSWRVRPSWRELEAFFAQRLAACDEARVSLAATGEEHLVPLVEFWRDRLIRLRRLFHDLDGDIVSALRDAGGERDGSRSSPPPRRTASSRCSPATRASGSSSRSGRAEHRRLFGRLPQGSGCPSAPTARAVRGSPGATAPALRPPPRHRGAPRRRGLPVLLRGRAPRRRPAARSASTATRRPARWSIALAIDPSGIGSRSPYQAYRGGALAAGAASPRWCGTRARRCRSGAGSRAIPATAAISSSTRCAGPADSSSGG